MKKLLGLLVIVLVGILLAAPWYAGQRAEQELHSAIATFNAQPGYRVEWSDYDRGWLSTRATLIVGVETLDQSGAPANLPLAVDIRHGPVLGTSALMGWFSWELQLSEQQNAWLREHLEYTGDADLYQARGHMGLLGSVEHQDELQAFKLTDPEAEATLTINAYSGQLTVDRSRQLHYEGAWQGMDLSSQDLLIVLGNTNLGVNGDLSRLHRSTMLYPSDFFVNIASLQMQGHDQQLEVTNAVFDGSIEMAQDADWFSLVTSISAGSIATPATTIADATMTLAYERIALEAYQAYVDLAMASVEAPDRQPDVQAYFTPEVTQAFFSHQPAFVLRNLSFSMPSGDFRGNVELTTKQGFTAPSIIDPFLLLQALAVQAEAEIDRPLAVELAGKSLRANTNGDPQADAAVDEQVEQMLNVLVEQGLVVANENQLTSTLSFIDGQLLVNGNPAPIPLELLFGGGGAMQ